MMQKPARIDKRIEADSKPTIEVRWTTHRGQPTPQWSRLWSKLLTEAFMEGRGAEAHNTPRNQRRELEND